MNALRNQLYDRLRRRWVADAPEERVRQSVIDWLIETGGYPLSLICVEQQLPLSGQGELLPTARPPLRRFDLLCLRRCRDRLDPLLLVECKAAKIGVRAKKQALDYNYYLGAPFVALACGGDCAFTSLLDLPAAEWPIWHQGLPTYTALLHWLSKTDSA